MIKCDYEYKFKLNKYKTWEAQIIQVKTGLKSFKKNKVRSL